MVSFRPLGRIRDFVNAAAWDLLSEKRGMEERAMKSKEPERPSRKIPRKPSPATKTPAPIGKPGERKRDAAYPAPKVPRPKR